MNRRDFLGSLLAGAAGLLLPEPPRVRAYSFMPGVGRGDEVDEEIKILVTGQSDAKQNGIYVVSAGNAVRAGDLVALAEDGGVVPVRAGESIHVVGQVFGYSSMEVRIGGQLFTGVKSLSWTDADA
jgi:hypothetical protein